MEHWAPWIIVSILVTLLVIFPVVLGRVQIFIAQLHRKDRQADREADREVSARNTQLIADASLKNSELIAEAMNSLTAAVLKTNGNMINHGTINEGDATNFKADSIKQPQVAANNVEN